MSEIDLEALAAKVEALEGPCRETDAAICEAFTGSVESDDGDYWYGPHDQMPTRVPDFTASLDATMSLIADLDEWQLSTIYNIARAEVGVNRDQQTSWPGYGEHAGCNPVLALLSAALKARASLSRLSPPPTEVKDNG